MVVSLGPGGVSMDEHKKKWWGGRRASGGRRRVEWDLVADVGANDERTKLSEKKEGRHALLLGFVVVYYLYYY